MTETVRGNRWFGEPWPSNERRAPICEDDSLRVPPPVGQICLFCDEAIEAGDRGTLMASVDSAGGTTVEPVHIECSFANVMGGAAHIDGGHCAHCGGEGDPEGGLTYRQSALEVWKAYITIGTYWKA